MAARTAWTPGNGAGLTWTTVINSSDIVSLASGSAVLSTVSDVLNGASLDQFMDISAVCASSVARTLSGGANLAFWIYPLNEDGTTYGDNQFTAGTQAAATPAFAPCAIVALPNVSVTQFSGTVTGIIIPPGNFRLAIQNNTGFGLSSTVSSGAVTQIVKYRTYNVQLNN